MNDNQTLAILSWIRGFHVYKEWWTPCFGDELTLLPEPENPKNKNAVSVLKDNRVVGHIPLSLANTKDGAGLVKNFLSKKETTGYVKVCGKAVNRGGGHGMEIPCEYVFSGPKNLMQRLESLFELSTNAAVRSDKTAEELDLNKKGRRRKRAASAKPSASAKPPKKKR